MAIDIPHVLFIRASGWFLLLNNLINHVAMNTCVQVPRGRVYNSLEGNVLLKHGKATTLEMTSSQKEDAVHTLSL